LDISVESKNVKNNATNNAILKRKLEGILKPKEFAILKTVSGKITAADENKATSNQRIAYFSFNLPRLMETRTKPIIKTAKMIATIGLFITYPFLA
jgi:hypothetical protein